MVRRIASQVHKQAGRLLRGNYLKTEPKWYQAVLQHPPLPLPARAPARRTLFDSDKADHPENPHHTKPIEISYIEDRVRRQFFRDHPFEAYRPRTLVELDRIEDEHPIRGTKWTRLSQRTKNPSPEEYVVCI
jgi:small subunit ribosomal protein S23